MRNGKQNQTCFGFMIFITTEKLRNTPHGIVLIECRPI